MKRFKNLFYSFLCVGLFVSVFAKPESRMIRSTLVKANGFASWSEDRPLKETRAEALADAKREALEKAETYIKSITRIENFQLQYDLVEMQSEGTVRVIQIKDVGKVAQNRYQCWIHAEVVYEIPVQGEKIQKTLEQSTSPLTVMLWTDKETYYPGESVVVRLRCNKDCYVRVIYVDAAQNIIQILPNRFRQNSRIRGGQVVEIPSDKDRFKLRVKPPLGEEKIVLYASSEPLGKIDLEETEGSPYLVQNDIEETGTLSRSIEIVEVHKEAQSADVEKVETVDKGAEFFEAECVIYTVETK